MLDDKIVIQILLLLVVVLVVVLVLLLRFAEISFNKNKNIYLFIKKSLYNKDTKGEIVQNLMHYWGFDYDGAVNLIEKAKADNCDYFWNLQL